MKKDWVRLLMAFFALVVFGLSARSVWGQGCAMCYQNAAGASAAGRAALRHGILVLLLPALSVFAGICVLIYRRRNSWR